MGVFGRDATRGRGCSSSPKRLPVLPPPLINPHSTLYNNTGSSSSSIPDPGSMSRSIEATRRRLHEDRKTNDMETQASQAPSSSSASSSSQQPHRPAGTSATEPPPFEIELDSPLKRNLKALLVLTVSVYGLREAKFVENLLWNKQVGSTALAVAVAAR